MQHSFTNQSSPMKGTKKIWLPNALHAINNASSLASMLIAMTLEEYQFIS